ncbi:MAG: hypothetical protein QOE61_3652 [Micromonosporaceae bacterium]|nr:hypothetical protein [Micromonosporaceae bacterium]
MGHWTPQRWAKTPNAKTPNADVPHAEVVQTAVPEGSTRADLMFRLVQRLADLAAEAEGRTRRPVPRLDNDLALVDQVRVMVLDLQSAPAPPPLLVRAALAIDAAAGAL